MRREPTRPPTAPPRHVAVLLLGAMLAAVAAQEPDPQLPRFRGGANLVRVDAYVSVEGEAVTDLTADDFEVLEDDQPQQVEGFELVRAGEAGAGSNSPAASPTSTRTQADALRDPEARLFVVYFDYWHLGLDGSARAAAPIAALLDQVVGENDLVGLMTPDIGPENITFTRRGDGLVQMLSDAWTMGQRDQTASLDPREAEIRACYADAGSTAGVAWEMIDRRREQKTLRSIDATIAYLDGVREERKFLILLSEGWVQFRQNDALARPLGGAPVPGGPAPIGAGPDGRIATNPESGRGGGASVDSCERERVMLSYVDHQVEIRQMAQRANRANVSFYPVDPRGAVVFDQSLARPVRPGGQQQDAERLASRQDGLRLLADQTGGVAVVNTNDTERWLQRALADTGTYYLLSYYSTNAKLDGRFRRITVRVNRENAEVRARPGYLAPTEAEARAGGADLPLPPGAKPAPSAAVARALESIAPTRGLVPLRAQATALGSQVRAVVEFDAATIRQAEWRTGGTLHLSLEPDRGGAAVATWSAEAPPSQRSVVIDSPADVTLAPGRYIVRVEARPSGGGAAVRASAAATVPAAGDNVAGAMLILRRGPATGLAYLPTADTRYRRTERIRAELPVFAPGVTAAGRVLTREGQPLPLQVAMSERTDEETATRVLVADVTLAPLAQGDYVLELTAGKAVVAYGFRIIP